MENFLIVFQIILFGDLNKKDTNNLKQVCNLGRNLRVVRNTSGR